MVTKYRGIRFFGLYFSQFVFHPVTAQFVLYTYLITERQKLLRKIKQTKKALLDTPDDHQLVNTLSEARVDLYYVVVRPLVPPY